MDAKTLVAKGSRVSFSLALFSAAVAVVVGCDEPDAKAEAAQTAPAVAPSEEAKSEPQPPAELAGKSSYQEEAFQVRLVAPEGVAAGKAATFKVVLEAQSGYKVNEEYPLKFQFADAAGVIPAKKTVRKEDATVEKKKAELPLSVTIEKAGKHKVGGKLSFSVCTDERCLIEKRDLAIDVNAS